MTEAVWTQVRLMFVVLIWGVNYKILPFGVKEFGAPAFTLLRFALTFPILILAVKLVGSKRIEKTDWPRLAVVGIIGTTLYQAIFAYGVAATTATNAAVLIALSPIFSFALSTLIRGTKHSMTNWAGLFVALVGAVFVISRGDPTRLSTVHLYGDGIMVFASFLWALYSFVAEPLTKKYGGLTITCWSIGPGLLGLAVISAPHISDINWASISGAAWWSLSFAVLFVTSMGLVFFYQAIQAISAQRVMAYMFLVPVAAMGSASVFFGDSLTVSQVLAAMLVVAGVYMARKPAAVQANVTLAPSERSA